MRRFWLVVPLTFALVAAACTSGGDGGGSASPGGSTAPVNLTMWMGYTPPPPENQSFEYNSLKSAVDAFTKENPNIHIDLQ